MYSSRLKNLSPYVPGEQPQDRKYIKLNTNENPYPPTAAGEKLLCSYPADDLKLYPDPESRKLREAVAAREGVSPEQVFVGNGSDEILSFCFYAFFDSSAGPLLFPEHTYSFYPVYCNFYSIPYRRVPLSADFRIPFSAVISGLPGSCGYIFPNPNAPTGIEEPAAEVEEIVKAAGRNDLAVIVDEAYIEFGGCSSVPLIGKYGNVLVVRTLSKSHSLAGIRLGYALGPKEMIEALTAVKNSFNSYPVDRLTEYIGIEALNDGDYYRRINSRVMESRKRLTEAMTETGWSVLPSKSNFVFMKKPGLKGAEIYRQLKERGILVRFFNHQGIEDFIRVTVGTEEDTETFIDTCRGLK